jgi:hypothetical protein
MTVSHRISWRNAPTCSASAGPGDQYRGGRPGQVEGVRNHRPDDQRPDVSFVPPFGPCVDSILISGQQSDRNTPHYRDAGRHTRICAKHTPLGALVNQLAAASECYFPRYLDGRFRPNMPVRSFSGPVLKSTSSKVLRRTNRPVASSSLELLLTMPPGISGQTAASE